MNNNLSTNSKLSTTKSFENLYCLDAKNKIKEWQIYVEDMVTHSVMIYSYGYIDGKKVECNQIINKGKNIGKKNSTTHFEQAIFTAESKWNKKITEGYSTNLESIKNSLINSPVRNLINSPVPINNLQLPIPNPLPMLANEYNKHKKKVESMLGKSMFMIQPKLDGYRMLYNTTSFEMTTRQGKNYTIIKESKQLYNELKLLPKGLILDGELYTPDINFESLGVLRKTKNLNTQDIENLSKIKYYIYDLIDEKLTFKDRNKIIKDLFSINRDMIVYVPTFEINSQEDITKYHQLFLEQGYEGSMIRNKESFYKLKNRSNDLLKLKNFKDAEFKIIDFTSEKDVTSNSDSTAELVIWIVQVNNTITCKVRPQGTREERQMLYKKCLENFNQFKNKNLWVKFFEFTSDGSLRFPTTFRNTYTEYIRNEIM